MEVALDEVEHYGLLSPDFLEETYCQKGSASPGRGNREGWPQKGDVGAPCALTWLPPQFSQELALNLHAMCLMCKLCKLSWLVCNEHRSSWWFLCSAVQSRSFWRDSKCLETNCELHPESETSQVLKCPMEEAKWNTGGGRKQMISTPRMALRFVSVAGHLSPCMVTHWPSLTAGIIVGRRERPGHPARG